MCHNAARHSSAGATSDGATHSVPYATTNEGLKEHFSQFGTLVDSIVMKFSAGDRGNRFSGKSRGFGFVTYEREEMVDECQANRPHKIDGALVETKRATPREENTGNSQSNKRLFIGGIK